MFRPVVWVCDLHATNPRQAGRHPKVAMGGGIFCDGLRHRSAVLRLRRPVAARPRTAGKCALFLLEISVQERLSGWLCDAVTGGEGSQALLEEAERAGLFLVPLDEVRGWWHCHRLFAGLLRARLQQTAWPGGAVAPQCRSLVRGACPGR